MPGIERSGPDFQSHKGAWTWLAQASVALILTILPALLLGRIRASRPRVALLGVAGEGDPRMAVDLEDTAAAVETGAVQGTGAETLRVFPNGCASCEADWLSRSKEAEDAEMARLEELRRENLPELGREIR